MATISTSAQRQNRFLSTVVRVPRIQSHLERGVDLDDIARAGDISNYGSVSVHILRNLESCTPISGDLTALHNAACVIPF